MEVSFSNMLGITSTLIQTNFILMSVLLGTFASVQGTHTKVDYEGAGYVRLTDDRLMLVDTDDFAIKCVVVSPTDIPITLYWYWRNNHTHSPDYYFTWVTTNDWRDGNYEYISTLLWKNDIKESRKRTASGSIYAACSHDDDTTKTTACSDIPITIIWPPTKPTVTHGDPIIIGTTAVLKCDTSDIGNPRSSVVWIKDGDNYTGPGSTNTSLHLPVTNTDDGARWECYYFNLEGKSETSDASILNVNWKPEQPNIASTSDNSNLRIDDTVNLRCIPSEKGNPDGRVKWKRNGAITSFTEESLSFAATKNHNGDKWCCYYKNTVGDGPCSIEIHLTVYWEPDKPTLKSAPEITDLNISQKVNLTCQLADKGNPGGQVVWLRDGTELTGSVYTDTTVNFFVSRGHNGSEWCCYFKNAVVKGHNADCITLIVSFPATPSHPQVMIDTDIDNIRVGDNVVLRCATEHKGTPEGQPVWLKNGIIQTAAQYLKDVINITYADASIIGVWRCYYSNAIDNSTVSNEIEIRVYCLPNVQIDYITHEFGDGSVHFNLKITDSFAATNFEVVVCISGNQVCSTSISNIEQNSYIDKTVKLPGGSRGAVYNITFTFSDEYRIVTRTGISLRDTSQINTLVILAALFGVILFIAIVVMIILVYLFYRRNKEKAVSGPPNDSIHYVNVDQEVVRETGGGTNMAATPEYEDVFSDVTHNDRTNYVDLNHADIQRTRNRPTELTVYQSLN